MNPQKCAVLRTINDEWRIALFRTGAGSDPTPWTWQDREFVVHLLQTMSSIFADLEFIVVGEYQLVPGYSLDGSVIQTTDSKNLLTLRDKNRNVDLGPVPRTGFRRLVLFAKSPEEVVLPESQGYAHFSGASIFGLPQSAVSGWMTQIESLKEDDCPGSISNWVTALRTSCLITLFPVGTENRQQAALEARPAVRAKLVKALKQNSICLQDEILLNEADLLKWDLHGQLPDSARRSFSEGLHTALGRNI